MHHHMLCQISSFFKTALESSFKEAIERVVSLPGEREKVVDRFVQWIYHEKVPDCETSPRGTEDARFDYEHRNCALYVFADKYGVPDLKRYSIRNLIQIISKSGAPRRSTVRRTYNHTVASSGLRRLICDWCAWRIRSNDLDRDRYRALLTEVPEFSADLVGALSRHWERRSKPKLDGLRASAYM